MLYTLLQIKRRLEEWLMWPFVQWGRLTASRWPLAGSFDLVCFYPRPSVGGAEKVNADLLRLCPDKRILVFFTKRRSPDSLLSWYEWPHVTLYDISAEADDKSRYWQSFIARGRCAGLLARMANPPAVFIGQCNFGYKMLPHLPAGSRVVELIHVSEKKFAWITFPFIPLLQVRTTAGRSIVQDHQRYYRELGVPEQYFDRWEVIPYSVRMPEEMPQARAYLLPLKIYYAGRGGAQKRVWLIMRIIRQCLADKLPVEFHLAGPLEDEIPDDIRPSIHYQGIIGSREAMDELHRSMDILLMTSAFEGFPVVIMEAMSHGVVPLVTAVDAIPEHIADGANGALLTQPEDEDAVVQQAVSRIRAWCGNPAVLEPLSAAAARYARDHFGEAQFAASYRRLLFGAADS